MSAALAEDAVTLLPAAALKPLDEDWLLSGYADFIAAVAQGQHALAENAVTSASRERAPTPARGPALPGQDEAAVSAATASRVEWMTRNRYRRGAIERRLYARLSEAIEAAGKFGVPPVWSVPVVLRVALVSLVAQARVNRENFGLAARSLAGFLENALDLLADIDADAAGEAAAEIMQRLYDGQAMSTAFAQARAEIAAHAAEQEKLEALAAAETTALLKAEARERRRKLTALQAFEEE